MPQTGSPSPLLVTYPYHFCLASLTLSTVPTSPSSLHNALISSHSSPLTTSQYHLNQASQSFSAMPTTPHLLISLFHNFSDQLSLISSYTCKHHLNLASLIFSAMSTTPYLLISSFQSVSDKHSFISSSNVSKSCQLCFPHLLSNALHPTFS